MDLFDSFSILPAATCEDYPAVSLSSQRRDFLAKTADSSPVFLFQDSSSISYVPSIELKHLTVRFHSTCRVSTPSGVIEDQFAVVSCNSATSELFELFIQCLAAVAEGLPVQAGTSDLQRSLRELLDLFQMLTRPSNREITGLWAELYIIAKSQYVEKALESWRTDTLERFDFSWGSGCLEIKATTKEMRIHDFSLEQLQVPVIGHGLVASLLLQPISGGVGVMDLAGSISDAVARKPHLKQKLWRNVAEALGNDFSSRLDRRFDSSYSERQLVFYSMADIPAPEQPSDPRITSIRFRADLTTAHTSFNTSEMLRDLFN